MIELPIGSVIKSKRVNYRRPRIAAMLVLGLGIAIAARVGTTVTVRMDEPKPVANYGPPISTHHTSGGGGGVIHVGN